MFFKLAVLTYRSIHGTSPSYPQSCFTRVADMTSRRRLRSSASHRLEVPPVRLRVSAVGEREFPVADDNIWNDLPFHITSAQSLAVFRQHLKTFLFSRSYPDILLRHYITYTDLLLFFPAFPENLATTDIFELSSQRTSHMDPFATDTTVTRPVREHLQAGTKDAPVLDRPAPLRHFHDSGAGHKYPDLLTYLLTEATLTMSMMMLMMNAIIGSRSG